MDRRTFIAAIAAGWAGAPSDVRAQQPAKAPRIGFLGPTSPRTVAGRLDALRAGLRDLGYVEGKSIGIEFRWAEGNYERLPSLAVELARLKVDVLVTQGTAAAIAAKQATTTIPIVMAIAVDAVATGIVASLARPGGNVTGSTFFGPELYGKRLELAKLMKPRLSKAAIVFNPANPSFTTWLKEVDGVAKSLKVELTRVETRRAEEFEAAFSAMSASHVGAFVVTDDALFNANLRRIAEIAAQKRLAALGSRELAEAGGLIGYGHDSFEMFRRAAYFVDRILKGARPADLPVERPTKFELVVNLKTAKALGLTIPQSLLGRADLVIQ